MTRLCKVNGVCYLQIKSAVYLKNNVQNVCCSVENNVLAVKYSCQAPTYCTVYKVTHIYTENNDLYLRKNAFTS